jgi:hypothetical protein
MVGRFEVNVGWHVYHEILV